MNEKNLPPGSIVLHRQPSFWELYKQYAFAAIFLILVQSAAILGLLWQRARRRKTEAELIRSEEKFSKSFRQSPLAISIASTKYGCYIDVNKTFEQQTGWCRDEVIGRSQSDINLWVDPRQRSLFIEQLLAEGNVRDLEVRIRRKDGRIQTVLGSAELIEVNGKPCTLSVIADVTERKQAEETIREAHRRLDQIIEFLPDATLVIDAESKVIAWNRAAEQMTGVPKAEMIGKGEYEYAFPFYGERRPILIDLALLPDAELEKRKYDIAQRSADTIYGDVHVPKIYGGGGAYLYGAASRLRDAAGNIVGAIESIRDITEIKQAEEELAKYRERLEQLVKERTQDLEAKTKALEELNISLKVLLRHREEDKKELEDRFVLNIKKLVMPFTEKMKRTHLDEQQLAYLSIIETHLNDITSSLTKKMHQFNFTPREVEVASLLNEGKTTKEIARIIGIATSSINTHRNQIRKKLGISKKKVNLRSHLQSFD